MEGISRDSEIYKSYIDNTPIADMGQSEDVGLPARFLTSPPIRAELPASASISTVATACAAVQLAMAALARH